MDVCAHDNFTTTRRRSQLKPNLNDDLTIHITLEINAFHKVFGTNFIIGCEPIGRMPLARSLQATSSW